MKWIRERALRKELLGGTFLNLGSSLTAEIASQAGFDWLLIDLEHGAGGRQELLLQLQAIEASAAVPLVRIAWNDPILVKQVLDLGVSGVMFPYIQTADDARKAVSAMRYPPVGIRGVAVMNRACRFGPGFDEYFKDAGAQLLTILQIETPMAIGNIDAIAATEDADVLFIGPMDLSVGFGLSKQWEHPTIRGAFDKVVNACQRAGKAAGMIVSDDQQLERAVADGFSMIAYSSDSAAIVKGLRSVASSFHKHQKRINTC